MNRTNQKQSQISTAQVREFMAILLPVPHHWWLAIVLIAILLSLFEITRTAAGEFTVTFRLTSITVILATLIWLPNLLRLLALLGGGIKTTAGEVNIPGLLASLAKLMATVDLVETKLDETQQQKVDEIRKEVERALSALPQEVDQARRQLSDLTQEYEHIRHTMPSGDARTFQMSTIVARIRTLARQANYSMEEIKALFEAGSDGNRIVALGILQALPSSALFDIALQAIDGSRSPFEQYQALKAAEGMVPLLNKRQQRQLREVVERNKYLIPENRDRWRLGARILKSLE